MIIAHDGVLEPRQLDRAAARVAAALLGERNDLAEARVAFAVTPGCAHVVIREAIWRAGGIAVPLALSHPPAELEHVIRDCGAALTVADSQTQPRLEPTARMLNVRCRVTTDLLECAAVDRPLPTVSDERRAMIVYTSGTTGRPKGVVTTHHQVKAQIASLVSAWEWTAADRLLHVLPLHHVHGIINGLGCALASGATCEMLPQFDPTAVWARLASGEITVFTAVPTIYHRLAAAWDAAELAVRDEWSRGARQVRLMMSGSAALPVQLLTRWQEITGHVLLERYGMTEIGMALANPLHGRRRPGSVGTPLPGVEVRVVDDCGLELPHAHAGELEVRGAGVFQEDWGRPRETAAAFRDGWFRTGDLAVLERGYYRLLGRMSVDIIKTGGFKVSALEIEEALRTHPAIAECAVVGLEDAEWGERVGVAVELAARATLTLEELQRWAKGLLAPYKVPRALRVVSALPRNAMGKVVKPDVTALFARKSVEAAHTWRL